MPQETAPLRDVKEPLPQPAQAARPPVARHAVAADAPLHAWRPMVAQILADAAQFMHHRDTELFQPLGLADAGELEQLRRGDRAGRDDDLACGARLEGLALHGVTHTDTAAALEQQALRGCAGLNAEIAPRARRIEIDARGRVAEAAADGGLRHRNAFLRL